MPPHHPPLIIFNGPLREREVFLFIFNTWEYSSTNHSVVIFPLAVSTETDCPSHLQTPSHLSPQDPWCIFQYFHFYKSRGRRFKKVQKLAQLTYGRPISQIYLYTTAVSLVHCLLQCRKTQPLYSRLTCTKWLILIQDHKDTFT